jgi:hypothetical protein
VRPHAPRETPHPLRPLLGIATALATAVGPFTGSLSSQEPTSIFTLLDVADRRIVAGEEVTGALTDQDYLAFGRRVQAWALEGRPGQALQFDLLSEDFDPLLYVAGPGVGEVSDDDGGEGLNSRLCVDFTESGVYRVVPSSYGGETGTYRVRTERVTSCADVTADDPDVVDLSTLDTGGRVLPPVGQVEGALTDNDAIMFDSPVQAWALEGRVGESVTVDLISDEFDAYLTVLGPGLEEWLADDDGAGLCNSRVTVEFPENGTYKVVVSSVPGLGSFTLRAYHEPPPPETGGCVPPAGPGSTGPEAGEEEPASAISDLPISGVLQVGGSDFGRLASSEGTFRGQPAHRWTLEGREGQQLAIEQASPDLDPYLYLRIPGYDELLYNDDSPESLDARICVTLPATGTYDVVASGFGAEVEGPYELTVTEDPGEERCSYFRFELTLALAELVPEDGTLRSGDHVTAVLDASDQRNPSDGSPLDVWLVELEAGEPLVVDLVSNDFDAWLHVLGPGVIDPWSDDDSGGGCNARIEFVAPRAGFYEIFANTFEPESSGEYTLLLGAEPGPIAEGDCGGDRSYFEEAISGPSRELPLGSQVSGELTAEDVTLGDGSHAEVWTLDVRAGQTVIVELLSADFDAFLYVLSSEDDIAMQDDDGLTGTDSRITFTAQSDGRYQVIVSSYGTEVTGSYDLRAIRMVGAPPSSP